MRRHTSEREYASSSTLLKTIKENTQDEIRRMLSEQQGYYRGYALTEPSFSSNYQFRTALMTAAERGDYGIFGTILRAFNGCSGSMMEERREAIVKQLMIQDAEGMTLTMIAAKSGNIMILKEVLGLVESCDDSVVKQVLTETDYKNVSVLMHACNSGRSAMFGEVFKLMEKKLENNGELSAQLTCTSGDKRTLLMHAAFCGEQMTLVALASTFRRILNPKKVRRLLKAKDFEGMTFLMHAASSCSNSEMHKPKKGFGGSRRSVQLEQAATGRHNGVANSGPPSFDLEGDAGDDARNTPSQEPRWGGQTGSRGEATDPSTSREEHPQDPEASVVIFKTAFNFYTDFLWKEQVREQLKEKDSWGRTVLTHAIMSGHKDVFESAFQAFRSQILDSELERLLAINANGGEHSSMEIAISRANGDMRDLVSFRHEQLKKAVAIREKASTIQAKIQSFIPGKFVVVYQLILPELDKETDQPLCLLLIMCALAPLFALAGDLIAREAPSGGDKASKTFMSFLLAAPALFFWGVGTSSVAQQSFNWSASSSSAALAVATIIIPALDAFFASRLVGHWFDKLLCKRLIFSQKARLAWGNQELETERYASFGMGGFGWHVGGTIQSYRRKINGGGGSIKSQPLRGSDRTEAPTSYGWKSSSKQYVVDESIDEGGESENEEGEKMAEGDITKGGERDETKEGGRSDGKMRDEEEGPYNFEMKREEKAADPFRRL